MSAVVLRGPVRDTYPGYRKVRAVNWSTLKALADSPLHYQHLLTHPTEETPGMRLGRAIHSAVLEPDAFPLEFVVYDGARRAGKEWDEFKKLDVERARKALTHPIMFDGRNLFDPLCLWHRGRGGRLERDRLPHDRGRQNGSGHAGDPEGLPRYDPRPGGTV